MSKTIGQIIFKQITSSDWRVWGSWGANQWTGTATGLTFYVRGAKFKGWVNIDLDQTRDLYNLEFFTMRRPRRSKAQKAILAPFAPVKKVHTHYEGIYWDQLVKLIDETVETK